MKSKYVLAFGLLILSANSVAFADSGALRCGTNKDGVHTRATFLIDELGTSIHQWDWNVQLTFIVDGHSVSESLNSKNAKYAVKSYSKQSGDFETVITAEKSVTGKGYTQVVVKGSTATMEHSVRGGTVTLYRIGTGSGKELIATTYCGGDAD